MNFLVTLTGQFRNPRTDLECIFFGRSAAMVKLTDDQKKVLIEWMSISTSLEPIQ